jgi:hypothetical protein
LNHQAETDGRPFPEKGTKKAQTNHPPSKGKKFDCAFD